MTNLDMRNMRDHHPQRGDQVEAWIKDRRDGYWDGDDCRVALDALLDEYRLAADTMRSLENIVNGDDEPPPVIARKKKSRLQP